MKDLRQFFFSGVALCALGAPEAAAAQGAQGGASDIIVTARRIEERLQDVPISITAYRQSELRDRNVTNGTELATFTPSLSTNTRNGSATASFAIRGFSQDTRTTASVAVYFADVVAPRGGHDSRPAGDGAGPGAFFDLQNVQVLKGPQGTLFGRNTTGGAILLVPNKPTAELEGYVEGSYGNVDMQRLQAVLNVPLSDTFRARIGADWMKRDGYLKNVSGVGVDRLGNVDYHAIRASLVGELAPNLENYTVAYYTRSKSRGDTARLASCVPGSFPLGVLACQQVARLSGQDAYAVNSHLGAPNANFTQWQIINTTTWKAQDALTVKNIFSYGQYRATGSNGGFGVDYVIPPVLSNTAGTINIPTGALAGVRVGFAEVNALTPDLPIASQSTLTEELRLEGHAFASRLQWQVGAYLEISDPLKPNRIFTPSYAVCTDIVNLQCTDPVGALVGATTASVTMQRYQTSYKDFGVYGQASFSITDKFKFTAGLRYTRDTTQATAFDVRYFFYPTAVGKCADPALTYVTPESCTSQSKVTTDAPTWLVGLDYKPIQSVLLYAKYSRGYRQGSTNILAAPGFHTYGPEKVDTYEIGAKIDWRGATPGFLNLAGFYNDFRQQQLLIGVIQLPASVNSATVNVGKSRIYGMEAEAGISPFAGLNLRAGYAYLDTRVLQVPTLTPPTGFLFVNTLTAGQELPVTSKHKFTANVTYALPVPESVGELSIGATYTYQSSQLVTGTTRIPAFGLLNLNLNWNKIGGSKIDLAVFANNVTDRDYVTYVNALQSSGFTSNVLGMPRMYGIRVRYNFGR